MWDGKDGERKAIVALPHIKRCPLLRRDAARVPRPVAWSIASARLDASDK